MNRTARNLAIVLAVVATAILAIVIVKGAITVLKLRQFGDTAWPLVAPLNVIPAAMIAVSVVAFARGRSGLSALLGIMALAVASIFWFSQASGALG
jgi:hypothetical protein